MGWIVSSVLFLLASGAPPAQASNQKQPLPLGGTGSQPFSRITAQVPGPLTINYGSRSVEWIPSTLAALPHVTVTAYNGRTKANETYSGVPLIDLLARLGMPGKPRGKDLLLYVVAEGFDGYKVVYSLAEVAPDVHDATVIVADSQDGKPLGGNGPFKLVATREKRPARWVRNLVNLRVFSAG